MHVVEGDVMCQSCFDYHACTCVKCGENIRDTNATCDEHEDTLCQGCFNDHYTSCSTCGDAVKNEDVQPGPNGEPLCEDCFGEVQADLELQEEKASV